MVGAFVDFLSHEMAIVMLVFVALFKFTDALSGAMTTPFVLRSRLFAQRDTPRSARASDSPRMLAGGFAGGFVARAYPLAPRLWIGALLQTFTILVFSGLALVGRDIMA